jgi:hypothetical protein
MQPTDLEASVVTRQNWSNAVTSDWEKTFLFVLFRCSLCSGFRAVDAPAPVLNSRKHVGKALSKGAAGGTAEWQRPCTRRSHSIHPHSFLPFELRESTFRSVRPLERRNRESAEGPELEMLNMSSTALRPGLAVSRNTRVLARSEWNGDRPRVSLKTPAASTEMEKQLISKPLTRTR